MFADRSDMQTELAERLHLCASDKQAKVCVRQECQTDLSSIEAGEETPMLDRSV